MFLPLLLVLLGVVTSVTALYTGEFQSTVWLPDRKQIIASDTEVKFIVALSLTQVEEMSSLLLDVSNPRSPSYGRYLSLDELSARFGPTPDVKKRVFEFFGSIKGAKVHVPKHGDLFEVSAPARSIETALNTELAWVTHARGRSEKKSVRALKPIAIPEDLHQHISFVSINAPVNHVMPRAAKRLANRRKEANAAAGISKSADKNKDNALLDAAAGLVGITPGNEEALAFFKPYCGLGATEPNTESPPCASSSAANTPTFSIQVFRHANSQSDPVLLSDEPTTVTVPNTAVYCYNTYSTATCSGIDGNNCTCIAKVSQLVTWDREFPLCSC